MLRKANDLFDYRGRQKRLFKRLRKTRKIPFLVTHVTDIRYLTGFSGSDAILLVGDNGVSFGTDGRYDMQSQQEVFASDTFIYERKKDFARRFFKRGDKIHFDRDKLQFLMFSQIRKWGYDLHPSHSPTSPMRMVKEEKEVEIIEKAAIISTTALLSTLRWFSGKTTEREFAARLEYEMKKRGAEGTSFPPIVAFGEKSALPHASPGEETLDGKQVMLCDYGSRFKGYCSDETITLLPENENADREIVKIMDVVRKARDVAIASLKEGVRCREVDKISREMIDKKGYGKYFVHSTGHGVGMDVHEPPYISKFSRDVLKSGMVITIEPGVYIPGKGGVRLEDLVKITENGYEKITYLPKNGKLRLRG